MKSINALKYLFAAVGVLMLVVALGSCSHTRSFLARAARTEGTVIHLVPVFSNNGTTYRPIVRFEYQGRQVQFASSTSSNPPSYREGETVPVLYLESDLSSARIDSFFSLYGLSAIAGGLGTVFFLIGAGTMVLQAKTRQTDERLRHQGLPITTDFQSVELNGTFQVNGRSPYRVVTQWQDPASSRLRRFESHNLWFDPTQFIKQKEIKVYVDPSDPQKYYMDLSFLPTPTG